MLEHIYKKLTKIILCKIFNHHDYIPIGSGRWECRKAPTKNNPYRIEWRLVYPTAKCSRCKKFKTPYIARDWEADTDAV